MISGRGLVRTAGAVSAVMLMSPRRCLLAVVAAVLAGVDARCGSGRLAAGGVRDVGLVVLRALLRLQLLGLLDLRGLLAVPLLVLGGGDGGGVGQHVGVVVVAEAGGAAG